MINDSPPPADFASFRAKASTLAKSDPFRSLERIQEMHRSWPSARSGSDRMRFGGGEDSALIVVERHGDLMDRVMTILDQARNNVVRAVNSKMVIAYWLSGQEIVQALQGGATGEDSP